MGKLQSARATDATKIGSTDDNVRNLESDLSEIIGVEHDLEIVNPIFASASDANAAAADSSTGQVNSDGSITGVLRMLSDNAAAYAAAGIEFQSTDGTRWKICATTTDLLLYTYNTVTAAWDEVYSFSTGISSFLNLTDVDPVTYVDQAGKVVVVNAGEDGLEFQAGAGGSVAKLEDIGDVPAYAGNAGDFLALTTPGAIPHWTSQVPGSGVADFTDLGDVAASVNVASGDAGKRIVIHNVGTFGAPSYKLAERPVYNVKSYCYGCRDQNLGKTNDANLLQNTFDGGTYYLHFGSFSSSGPNYGEELEDEVLPQYSGAGGVTPEICIPGLYIGMWDYTLTLRIATRNGRGFYIQQANDTGFNENRRMGPQYHTNGCPMQVDAGGRVEEMLPGVGSYHEWTFNWSYLHASETATAPKFTIKITGDSEGSGVITFHSFIGYLHAVMRG